MEKGLVSIITINYNGYTDTCELLDSLKQNEIYPYEVIVVDNASENNEASRLQSLYPEVSVVSSLINKGFAGGNNLGIKQAKGEYILFLNNDMTICSPFLSALVDRMRSNPTIGMVSGKIKYENHKNIIQYAGYQPMTPIRIKNSPVGMYEEDSEIYNIAGETFFAHGACMLTSREILNKVGVMTEIYFLFYEELDWSLQFKKAGYSIWYEPGACVYHKESMSVPRGTPSRNYYLTRSRLLFARRNTKGWEKIAACLYQVLIVYPINVCRWLRKKDWHNIRAISAGLYAGLLCKKN